MSEDFYGNESLFYEKFYNEVICDSGIGAIAVRKTHKNLESSVTHNFYDKCLEVGAGSGEHLKFVLHGFNEYVCLDIRETKINSQFASDVRVKSVVADASNIPYPNNYFDRVLMNCVLHHVKDPEQVLSELFRVLKSGGEANLFVSCDPSMLVRLLRKITVARKSQKLGFQGYDLMIAREHRNHFPSLLQLLKYQFRDCKIKIKYFPLYFRVWNINAYVIVKCTK